MRSDRLGVRLVGSAIVATLYVALFAVSADSAFDDGPSRSPSAATGSGGGPARGPGPAPAGAPDGRAEAPGAAGVGGSPSGPARDGAGDGAAVRAGTSPAATAGSTSPRSAPVTPTAGSGRGFDDATIHIGIELLDENSSSAAGAIGASTTDTGPTRRYAQAVVDHVNAAGGLAGRQVVPYYHTTNLLGGTWDSQAQEACAAFAEDRTVFAVVASFYSNSDLLPPCLAAKGVPLTENGRAVRDDATLRRLADHLYLPSRMSAERWAALTVRELGTLGYFAPGEAVGLVRFDTPALNRAVDSAMKPQLAAMGVSLAADERISKPNGLQEFGNASAQISNAVLRLRAADVTRVVPVDDHGTLAFLLMPQAESQGYRPRYGLSTNNQPFVQEENSPRAQLVGAVGVGWAPSDDVSFENDALESPEARRCRHLFDSAGLGDFPSRYAWSNALNYCDSMLFLKAALDRAPELSPAGLRAGVAALGDGYVSALTFRTRYTRDRHDGASAARHFRFVEECSCFRYSGAAVDAP